VRPDSPLLHAKHIVRAAVLLVVGVVVLVLGRSLFVPSSWGQYGAYRGANRFEQMAVPVRHGGNTSCAECHPDEYDTVTSGSHHTLACEGCHAPLASHVADDELVADMPIRRSVGLCLNCHQELEGRPAAQPQINAAQHVEEQGGELTEDACFDCHEAHSPL
jgi:hypothetical protein